MSACYTKVVMIKKDKGFRYFLRTISIVIGLVLVWRGVWHMLDAIDILFFGGFTFWTSFAGVVLGLVVLYIPDHDLKEIEKL